MFILTADEFLNPYRFCFTNVSGCLSIISVSVERLHGYSVFSDISR